jgi:Fe-S-cluster containining protein
MKQQKNLNKVIMDMYTQVHEQGEKLSCFDCKSSYCCENKVKIEIIGNEFTILKKLITQEHKEQAKKAFIQKAFYGQYTCPFLNNEGRCSVYHYRPMTCSIYAVSTPSENCKDPLAHSAIVSPNFVFSNLPKKALKDIAKQKRYDLLDLFKN